MTGAARDRPAGSPPQAVVLCGGLGTRLGALTADMPKPLLPVGDRPFLDVLLFELGRHGVRRVLLLAAFHADKIARYATDNPVAQRFGIDLEVAVEPDQAGTGGALWHARSRIEDRFLLLNGDSWFDFNLLALCASGASSPEADAVMALRALPDASRYGVATLEGDRVTRFAERPDAAGPGLVNAGVYLLSRAVVEACAPSCSLERDILPDLVAQGRVRSVVRSGYFIDIGVPETFAAAQTAVPARLRRSAVFLSVGAVLRTSDQGGADEDPSWVPGAPAAIGRLNEAGLYVFLLRDQADAQPRPPKPDRETPIALVSAGAHVDTVAGPGSQTRLLSDLLEQWPVKSPGSLVVAERGDDLQAARAAGMKSLAWRGGELSTVVDGVLGPA